MSTPATQKSQVAAQVTDKTDKNGQARSEVKAQDQVMYPGSQLKEGVVALASEVES